MVSHDFKVCAWAWLLKVDEEGGLDRKEWIENRLKLLTANFSVAVGGFSIMDNHLHVLCRLDPDLAKQWSDEDVVRRWIDVYPPHGLKLDDEKILKTWIKQHSQDARLVALYRDQLMDLVWFMKALKDPLSRLANRHGGCGGEFRLAELPNGRTQLESHTWY